MNLTPEILEKHIQIYRNERGYDIAQKIGHLRVDFIGIKILFSNVKNLKQYLCICYDNKNISFDQTDNCFS